MAVQFDEYGYVIPYTLVPLGWDDFMTEFGWNDVRSQLLADCGYLIDQLSGLLPLPLRCWIDGSFATKKLTPGDLDIVIFILYTHFARVTSDLQRLKIELAGRIDCYFVEEFPAGHPKYAVGRADELTWYHFLKTDRRKRKKGIVELLIQ